MVGAGACLEDWQLKQVAQEAQVTAFVGDLSGCVWQIEIRDGLLVRTHKVASILCTDVSTGSIKASSETRSQQSESVTALQWSQRSGALVAATSQGRLLRYSCSTDSLSLDSTHIDHPPGKLHRLRPVATCSATPASWHFTKEVQTDGCVTSLMLDPELLLEGVVATAAATAWYVDFDQARSEGQKAPLICGHGSSITGLVTASNQAMTNAAGSTAADDVLQQPTLVVSTAQDGVLRVWDLTAEKQASVSHVDCLGLCLGPQSSPCM